MKNDQLKSELDKIIASLARYRDGNLTKAYISEGNHSFPEGWNFFITGSDYSIENINALANWARSYHNEILSQYSGVNPGLKSPNILIQPCHHIPLSATYWFDGSDSIRDVSIYLKSLAA